MHVVAQLLNHHHHLALLLQLLHLHLLIVSFPIGKVMAGVMMKTMLKVVSLMEETVVETMFKLHIALFANVWKEQIPPQLQLPLPQQQPQLLLPPQQQPLLPQQQQLKDLQMEHVNSHNGKETAGVMMATTMLVAPMMEAIAVVMMSKPPIALSVNV